MKDFNYGKKYHYILKYLIISVPFILLIICLCSQTQTLNYSYINDRVNSVSQSISVDTTFLEPLKTFYTLSINTWYSNFITNLFNLNLTNWTWFTYVYFIPLWIMWVYSFDLVLDIIVFIPRLAHRFLQKFNKEEY